MMQIYGDLRNSFEAGQHGDLCYSLIFKNRAQWQLAIDYLATILSFLQAARIMQSRKKHFWLRSETVASERSRCMLGFHTRSICRSWRIFSRNSGHFPFWWSCSPIYPRATSTFAFGCILWCTALSTRTFLLSTCSGNTPVLLYSTQHRKHSICYFPSGRTQSSDSRQAAGRKWLDDFQGSRLDSNKLQRASLFAFCAVCISRTLYCWGFTVLSVTRNSTSSSQDWHSTFADHTTWSKRLIRRLLSLARLNGCPCIGWVTGLRRIEI